MAYDSWCDRHLFVFTVMPASRRAHLSWEVIHSNYPLENDSLFVVKHNVVGVFYEGLPRCADHECICFDLGLKLPVAYERVCFYVMAIFCLTCLSKSTWMQRASLVVCLSSEWRGRVQGQNPQSTCTQTHTRSFFAPAVRTNIYSDGGRERGQERQRHNETPSKVSRAPNGSKNLPLFFLPGAHLWGQPFL